jgi:alkaline phosphatase
MSNYMVHEGTETPPHGHGGFAGIYGYDPAEAWADWFYQQDFSTDSGASATSMSTGVKTYLGAIGMGVGGGPGARELLSHLLERAEALGKATGVVTSVQLSHATPAGFVAHDEDRENYAEIANDMVESDVEVVMGCGHPNYDNDGNWDPADPGNPDDWMYVGGFATWRSLENGVAGGDRPWTLIETEAEFQDLADGTLVAERVFGVARVEQTLQFERSGKPGYNDPEPPYTRPFISGVPTLAVMARGALNVLGADPDGFFLVIEGGAVDWAGHQRVLGRLIEEQNEFNSAIDEVVDWVETNSSWGETCVVVTGDHETGFLWGPGVDPGEPATWFRRIEDRGAGVMPGFHFYSEPDGPNYDAGHSNQVIPFFCRGSGSTELESRADESDPVWGDYLDNTEIALVFLGLWDVVAVRDRDVTRTAADCTLHANTPNPFNPQTRIRFDLQRAGHVKLCVFDPSGRPVKVLVDEVRAAASHAVLWDGKDSSGHRVASGIYHYQISSGGFAEARKMTLAR